MKKLCIEILSKQSKQEEMTTIQNFINGIVVLDNTKRQLYGLEIDEKLKIKYILQIDQMIQMLEHCQPISKNQLLLFYEIKELINRSE